MNHRELQRVFFRMLMDEDFRKGVLAGEPGLDHDLNEEELQLLSGLDATALAADPGDSRRKQALGNLLGEFRLTACFAPASARAAGFPDAFLRSEAFHRAIREEDALPLAFATWLEDFFRDEAPAIRSVLAFEAALVRCRRSARTTLDVELQEGEVKLSPRVLLHAGPAGIAGFLTEAASLIEKTREPVLPEFDQETSELHLLKSRPAGAPFALPEVDVEVLNPAIAGLLELARSPLSRVARRNYAAELGVSTEDLEEFVTGLVDEGVLIRAR